MRGLKGKPFPFKAGGLEFQVVLGYDEVKKIEHETGYGLDQTFHQMQSGMYMAALPIIMTAVKVKTEVGFQEIEYGQVAAAMTQEPTGELDEDGLLLLDEKRQPLLRSPMAEALVLARAELGNALGFVAPSQPASKSGSDSDLPSETSSKEKTGSS